VKNVDAVIHAAAPINVTPEEPKGEVSLYFFSSNTDLLPDIIEPSVNGAIEILRSAMKNGYLILYFATPSPF
jgi:hypothetical protein